MHETPISGEKINSNSTEHIARIEGLLARVFRKNGFEGVVTRTPLSDLINKESGHEGNLTPEEEVQEIRQDTFREILRYIFAQGPHPGFTMRRVYVLARAFDPDLIAQMNGTDLAVLFAEGRAAQSARVNLMFTGYLKRNGTQGTKMPFQKPESACRKMAKAQKGNQNRKGKKIAREAQEKRRKTSI